MTTDLQTFTRTLFTAADQLWTNSALRPDQFAQPVLALIALRQMEAKFEAVHAELVPQYKGRLKPAPADYQAKGAIYLPENARFSRLLALPGTADLGAELNAAMKAIAEFGIFASLAEFERDLISERTRAGLASARALGRKGGRKPKMTSARLRLAMAAMGKPETNVGELCRELGITRSTLYRHVSPDGEPRANAPRLLGSV